MHPDFLAVGHVTRDRVPGGFVWGGAVTYGALTAQRLGLLPAVVTSARSGLDAGSALTDIPVHVVASDATTTFRNQYPEGRRTQTLESVANPISFLDVPEEWRSAPTVLLGPLTGEVGPDLVRGFPDSIVMASLQGWLRTWDRRGRVAAKRWEGNDVLPYVDIAIASSGDVEDEDLIETWAELAPILTVTMGPEGSRLHVDGSWHSVEPFLTRQADPTGAGDVFAAAFLARYRHSGDPLASAQFASCAASFCVEALGTAGIPTLAQVEERLRDPD